MLGKVGLKELRKVGLQRPKQILPASVEVLGRPKDHMNVGILQTMASAVPVASGPRTGV